MLDWRLFSGSSGLIKMNLNFSANLNMLFTEVSFINRIKQAKESGFDNVEFLFPYDEGIGAIKKEIKRHNQNIVLFNLHYGEDKSKEWGTLSNPNRKEYSQQSFHEEKIIKDILDSNIGLLIILRNR